MTDEETERKLEIARICLNKILILSSGELAYTSEFTERVKALCYRALMMTCKDPYHAKDSVSRAVYDRCPSCGLAS